MSGWNFEFVIPLKREDLLSSQTPNQFYVSEVFLPKDLKSKISECRTSIKENGCDFVLEDFPTLFSVLQNYKNLDFKFMQSFYNDVIVLGLRLVHDTLCLLFEDEELHSDVRCKMLNVTKMMIYIAAEFLKCVQEKIDQTYSLVIDKRGKKNSKLEKLKEDHSWDWEENEKLTLATIRNLVKLPLHRLWDPPIPEQEFVRMIEDCCYSVLEKPSITATKMKPTRELLFEILAVLITQYNNSISCKVKIVQMIKLYEHLVSVLAQAVIYFVERHNCRSLIKEIIIEIIETDIQSESQDTSSLRAFSGFIVEIAAEQPQLVLPCVNLLIHSLTCDSYTMRICVLTVLAEVVMNVLTFDNEASEQENNEELDEKRKCRNAFLEHLLDHMIDVNSFVRAKVLRLWQEMYKRKSVPKHYVIMILDRAIQRLDDKSSNVRKCAIQLIGTLLENNLFGALINDEGVKETSRNIKRKIIEKERACENASTFKIWFCLRTEIFEYMNSVLKNEQEESVVDRENGQCENEDADESIDKSALTVCVMNIHEFVVSQRYDRLISSLIDFEEKFLKKLKYVNRVSYKVQYYQWILGNICKGDFGVVSLSKLSECRSETQLKSLIDEPVCGDDILDVDFGTDKITIEYCESYLKFAESMRTATAVIAQLMMAGSAFETIEAIEFFKIALQFNVSGAEQGVRNMLLLVESKESTVKQAVVNAFKAIYLNAETEESDSSVAAVEKLTVLLRKVSHEQKNALNHLIQHWISNNDLGPEFIRILWDKYSRKLPNTTVDDSRAAAILISMCSRVKPQIIKSNIELLIKYGLGSENRKNYALVKFTCQMFRSMRGAKDANGTLMKFPADSELIVNLRNVVEEQFFNKDNNLYSEIAMEIIDVIYLLSEFPDATCANMMKRIYRSLSSKNASTNDDNGVSVFNEEYILRLILIIGHVAFCQWQYLEVDVSNELKRRNTITLANEERNRKSRKSCGVKGRKKQSTNDQNATENFEDDAIAVANERIAETIRMVCENEILEGDTVLGILAPVVVKICQNPDKYKGNRLKSVATLSLAKMMMSSSEFCNQHIQLFVTILEKTEQPEVKINLILAFGDLTFRFPNTVEPWTIFFYNRLRDECANVRYTSLLVIAHLITNEMVKVKGQMSDVALCLVDDDPTIKELAFHLFSELSVKGNALYNVIPDIISRLSHPDHRTSEHNFKMILKKLMKLIVKDKHMESIVEKLCHRLRGASDERQCVDLSYCLTLVTYTENIMQKLVDNMACYADKLNFVGVRKNFTTILIACKRQSKTAKLTEMMVEFENKIDIILTKGVDNLDANFLKVPKTPAKTPKTPRFRKSTMTSARKLKSRKRIIMDSSSEDSCSSNEE